MAPTRRPATRTKVLVRWALPRHPGEGPSLDAAEPHPAGIAVGRGTGVTLLRNALVRPVMNEIYKIYENTA